MIGHLVWEVRVLPFLANDDCTWWAPEAPRPHGIMARRVDTIIRSGHPWARYCTVSIKWHGVIAHSVDFGVMRDWKGRRVWASVNSYPMPLPMRVRDRLEVVVQGRRRLKPWDHVAEWARYGTPSRLLSPFTVIVVASGEIVQPDRRRAAINATPQTGVRA